MLKKIIMRVSFNIFVLCVISFCIKIDDVRSISEEEGCQNRRFRSKKYIRKNCPENVNFYYPWPNDKNCEKFKVHLSPPNTWAPKALVSFDMAESVWFRHMIERASGYVTKGSYTFPSGPKSSHDTQCELRAWDGRSIVQALSDGSYEMLPNYFKSLMSYKGEEVSHSVLARVLYKYHGIILVRNPWDSLAGVSGVVLRDRSRGFDSKSFHKYMTDGAQKWVDHLKVWIENSPDGENMVIVKYEDVVSNPEQELGRVLKYLDIPVDEERLKCVVGDDKNLKSLLPKGRNGQKLRASIAKSKRSMDDADMILKNGMVEINDILKKKGIALKLEYEPSFPYSTDIFFPTN